MKLFPEKKLFIVGYIIGTIFNLSNLLKVGGLGDFLMWVLIGNTINAIVVIILLRISIWIGKKAGLIKNNTK